MEYIRVRSGVIGGFLWGLLLAVLLGAGWSLLPWIVVPGTRPASEQPVQMSSAALLQPGAGRFAPPANAAPQFQPAQHARNADIRRCLPAIDALAKSAIDTGHTAFSTWFPKDADRRMFQSIVGLKYESPVAPHGLSVLIAAPAGPGAETCDGATVQVHPSQIDCAQIAQALPKGANGQPVASKPVHADLSGLTLAQTGASSRIALIPLKPQGCIVVGVGMQFGK